MMPPSPSSSLTSILRVCIFTHASLPLSPCAGLKTIVGAVIESVKNLRDVIILTVFSLSVFALLGLQIYMGVLTQKCIRNFPPEEAEKVLYTNTTAEYHRRWAAFNTNSSNWHWMEGKLDPALCGNSSGAGTCPVNYTCYQGFGRNPNYGFTSFDTFGWSFLSAFRFSEAFI